MEEEASEAKSFDRRGFLKRVAVATAFAVPIISSFSMDGVNTVFAGVPGSNLVGKHGNLGGVSNHTTPI